MDIPLAEKIRPRDLESLIGHEDVLRGKGLIAELYRQKSLVSLILWGPPGTGKTTLARILAHNSGADFIELSAVTAGVADVRVVIERARANQRLMEKTVLFVDEIHRFNKAQQDAFLPHVESGLITLIGATTENPSFEVITPLLSRCRVVVLKRLDQASIIKILDNARTTLKLKKTKLPDDVLSLIASIADGDARRALGILDLSLTLSSGKITKETIKNASQSKLAAYDKNGEQHYDLISAFIKSMRGSDANAALYYAARILEGGEDPRFLARRMVIFASEDIGVASSPALNLAISTYQAVERIGLPECEYNLYHCVIVLAASKKSRVVADAMMRVKQVVQTYGSLEVPIHLRNAPTKLMKEIGYGDGYEWKADFKHQKGFLPPELKDSNFVGNND